jgi:serine/threonine protein kinase/tetratricopeptide (TPR) repeat protein
MNAADRQIMSILGEAVEHHTPEDRAAYLDRVCVGDPKKRARVDALLGAYEAAGNFMQGNPSIPAQQATVDEPITECPGTLIGPYKLQEQIGEGGMGLVFVADQEKPIRRRVALKVIKPGMDSRQVIARFEAERQALAMMDHPNIAHVLDAGTTDSGRPYFVMDLVKGVPITQYCDQHKLTTRQRLELFLSVCQAVQHAHQKGIIHRDLKPANVLVTVHDVTPVVKIIDFGIAKATARHLTDLSVYTGFSQLIGTPLYMSPEQAGMSGLDIDTRSDIYSLGVLLYELLTGSTPFDLERLKGVDYDELRRIIREEEPPRPSTRLSTLEAAELATVAVHHGIEPRRLRRELHGDLDWIVMKCLEKDRNRRYESASALARDIERHLHDEPVEAGPPGAAYRLQKLAARYRRALISAAVGGVLLLVAVGSVAASVGWVARDRAARRVETERGMSDALAEADSLLHEGDSRVNDPRRWQASLRLAQLAVERAEELQKTGDSSEGLTAELHEMREAVEQALFDSRIRLQLDEIRLDQATMSDHGDLGFARAVPRYAALFLEYGIDLNAPQQAAARIGDSRLRDALVAALTDWSWYARNEVEERQIAEALRLCDSGDAFRRQWQEAFKNRDKSAIQKLAAAVDVQKTSPNSLMAFAADLGKAREYNAQEKLLRAGHERYPEDFWLNLQMGVILMNGKPARPVEALRFLQAALALRGPESSLHNNLGRALHVLGDLDGAVRELRTALKMKPNLAPARNNLGLVLMDQGNLKEAILEFQAVLESFPDYTLAHNNIGLALWNMGDFEGAIRACRAALKLQPDLAAAHNNLGLALLGKRDRDGAIDEFHAAIRIDPNYADAYYNLGIAVKAKGDLQGAIKYYRKALEIHPNDPDVRTNLGNALAQSGQLDEAIHEFKAAIRINPTRPMDHHNLAVAFRDKGDLYGAVYESRFALELDPKYVDAHVGLGTAFAMDNKFDQAIRAFQDALQIDPDNAKAHSRLAKAFYFKKDLDSAMREYQAAIRIKPNDVQSLVELGAVFMDKGELAVAASSFEAALKLDPDNARAYCSLGQIHQRLGRLKESAQAYRKGHELGSRERGWNLPSGKWLSQAEQLAELDSRLPGILNGDAKPKDAADAALQAKLCQKYKQCFAAAYRLYRTAFDLDPSLADNQDTAYRYDAACVAALAACGQGRDVANLEDAERARIRAQALEWLQADLAYYRKSMENGPAVIRDPAVRWLEHCRQDPDFSGLRGNALDKQPETDGQAWRQFWKEVDATLLKRGGPSAR